MWVWIKKFAVSRSASVHDKHPFLFVMSWNWSSQPVCTWFYPLHCCHMIGWLDNCMNGQVYNKHSYKSVQTASVHPATSAGLLLLLLRLAATRHLPRLHNRHLYSNTHNLTYCTHRGELSSTSSTGQDRTGSTPPIIAGGQGRNVNASKPYTLNDKPREDSTVVVQGEWRTGVTELSGQIRLLTVQDPGDPA